MSLDTAISLTDTATVLDYLGIDAQKDALWIYYSASASSATVQVALDHLILEHNGGGDADFDLTNASYNTITELVAAINAVANWEAGAICHGSSDTTDLLETGQLDCLGSENEIALRITGDYLIAELINRASDFLNRYCNRTLKTTSYTLERYSGVGAKLFLNNYPVTAIVQICDGTLNGITVQYTSSTAYNAYVIVSTTGVNLIVDGTALGAELTFATYPTLATMAAAINGQAGWAASVFNSDYNSYPSSQLFQKMNRFALNQYAYLEIPGEPIDEYEVDYDNGVVNFSPEFYKGFLNVFVSHTSGFTTIPYSLEQMCIDLVKYKYDKRDKDSAVQSERIGSVYQYTLKDLKDALSEEQLGELDLFKKRMV